MSDARHILFVAGIPASGKSTFAKELVRSNPKYKRVNKDELRFLVHDEDYSAGYDRKKENFIEKLEDDLILRALNDGYSVVVDDTNLHPKHFNRVCKIAAAVAESKDCTITVQVKVIDAPLEECLRRNALRTGRECVPEAVIKKMHKELTNSPLRGEKGRTFTPAGAVERPWTPGLPECIVTDADGTTCLLNGRNPYDAKGCINDLINEPVVGLLHDLMHHYPIVVVSGREDKHYDETTEWYRSVAGVRFYDPEKDEKPVGIVGIHMRKTGDNRSDAIIKPEIYRAHILPVYNVRFVLDDRRKVVDAIRAMGIPVFQVAPGDF